MDYKLRWSSIHHFNSRKEALEDQFKLSGQWLKKYGVGKDWLQKPCHYKDEISLPIEVFNKGMISPFYDGPAPRIIKETDLFLVVHKPCRVHTHPLSYDDDLNMLSFLRSQDKFSFLDVNKSNYDRGLLYRLDFETSGLLILTNKESLYLEARSHFNERVKEKIYLCIVKGEVRSESELSSYLTKSSQNGEKMKVTNHVVNENSSLGKLSFKKIDYNPKEDTSLLMVNLETGLRHQIRAQLADNGHPILGDELYGGPKCDRLYLHCYRYQFQLGGMNYEFIDSDLGSFSLFFNLNGRF